MAEVGLKAARKQGSNQGKGNQKSWGPEAWNQWKSRELSPCPRPAPLSLQGESRMSCTRVCGQGPTRSLFYSTEDVLLLPALLPHLTLNHSELPHQQTLLGSHPIKPLHTPENPECNRAGGV